MRILKLQQMIWTTVSEEYYFFKTFFYLFQDFGKSVLQNEEITFCIFFIFYYAKKYM